MLRRKVEKSMMRWENHREPAWRVRVVKDKKEWLWQIRKKLKTDGSSTSKSFIIQAVRQTSQYCKRFLLTNSARTQHRDYCEQKSRQLSDDSKHRNLRAWIILLLRRFKLPGNVVLTSCSPCAKRFGNKRNFHLRGRNLLSSHFIKRKTNCVATITEASVYYLTARS